MPIEVRKFIGADVEPLLEMMKDLARFENYIDDFKVTTEDLVQFGLCAKPDFNAFVAVADDGNLAGMAVIYVVPWTYDMRPTLIMKELFVKPQWRSQNVGEQLVSAVFQHGDAIGASRVQWTVLKTNQRAKDFYLRNGGISDATWELWGRYFTADGQ